MARSSLVAIACLLFASYAAAQSSSNVSPLIDYFSNTNSSTYSYFWTALQAAHLDNYLNDSSLTLTVFAPTNDAWIKRMPTLTRQNNINVDELFSESKSPALQNMLQYTFLNQLTKANNFKDGDFLSTLANLCSDAKTLSISVNGDNITLVSAGGSRPMLMDRGILVGDQSQSIVYAIDDVLLPSVVTIPLSVALSNFNASGNNIFSPTIAQKTGTLDTISQETASEPPALIYLAPQTAPSGAPGSSSSTSTSAASSTTTSPSSTSSSSSSRSPSPTPTASKPTTSTTPAATKAPAAPNTSGVDTGVSSTG